MDFYLNRKTGNKGNQVTAPPKTKVFHANQRKEIYLANHRKKSLKRSHHPIRNRKTGNKGSQVTAPPKTKVFHANQRKEIYLANHRKKKPQALTPSHPEQENRK